MLSRLCSFFSPDALPATRRRKAETGKPLAGVKLRLVVVDDPAIATAVRGLRDEWNAQTGAEVEVIEAKTDCEATSPARSPCRAMP